jgi:hypothetical protein
VRACVHNRNSVILQHAPIIVIVKERLDMNDEEKEEVGAWWCECVGKKLIQKLLAGVLYLCGCG